MNIGKLGYRAVCAVTNEVLGRAALKYTFYAGRNAANRPVDMTTARTTVADDNIHPQEPETRGNDDNVRPQEPETRGNAFPEELNTRVLLIKKGVKIPKNLPPDPLEMDFGLTMWALEDSADGAIDDMIAEGNLEAGEKALKQALEAMDPSIEDINLDEFMKPVQQRTLTVEKIDELVAPVENFDDPRSPSEKVPTNKAGELATIPSAWSDVQALADELLKDNADSTVTKPPSTRNDMTFFAEIEYLGPLRRQGPLTKKEAQEAKEAASIRQIRDLRIYHDEMMEVRKPKLLGSRTASRSSDTPSLSKTSRTTSSARPAMHASVTGSVAKKKIFTFKMAKENWSKGPTDKEQRDQPTDAMTDLAPFKSVWGSVNGTKSPRQSGNKGSSTFSKR